MNQAIPMPPGYGTEWSIPQVSLNDAKLQEEFRGLFLTAVGGAANLLVSIILDRTDGAISLPVARACAISMVSEAVDRNLAVSEDTRGFFVAWPFAIREALGGLGGGRRPGHYWKYVRDGGRGGMTL